MFILEALFNSSFTIFQGKYSYYLYFKYGETNSERLRNLPSSRDKRWCHRVQNELSTLSLKHSLLTAMLHSLQEITSATDNTQLGSAMPFKEAQPLCGTLNSPSPVIQMTICHRALFKEMAFHLQVANH